MIPAPDADPSKAEAEPGASPHDWIGRVIEGRYRVSGWLGSGGMGDVFEVVHTGLGKRFALKALRPELARDRAMVERFRRESQAMATLVSEHVVSILDSGELASGAPYFVMERLVGHDLRRLLEAQAPLTPARVCQLGVDACRGLAAVHAAGLVHRDLKPENLFVSTGDDGREVCRILDFGVAKSARDNSTRPGALVGTTRYMAPEQVGMEHPLGPHTDVYALAVILYECLTGVVPFDGDTVERVLFKIMTEQERPLRELCPHAPPELLEAVHAALRKQPQERTKSALELAAALLPHTAPHRPRFLAAGLLEVVQPSFSRPDPGDATPAVSSVGSSTSSVSRERTIQEPRARGRRPLLGAMLAAGSAASAATWIATRAPSGTSEQVAEGEKVVASAASASRAPSPGVEPTPSASAAAREPASMLSAAVSGSSTPPRAVATTSRAAPPAAASDISERATHSDVRTRRAPDVPATAESAPPPAAFDPKNPYGP